LYNDHVLFLIKGVVEPNAKKSVICLRLIQNHLMKTWVHGCSVLRILTLDTSNDEYPAFPLAFLLW
jgi:hypothetical protein